MILESRLREVKAVETRKLAREEARNVLEAYIYKVRDLVDQPSFKAASLESERKVIEEKNEAANEWLWDEADQAPTKDLKDKKSELEYVIFLFLPYAKIAGLTGFFGSPLIGN